MCIDKKRIISDFWILSITLKSANSKTILFVEI